MLQIIWSWTNLARNLWVHTDFCCRGKSELSLRQHWDLFWRSGVFFSCPFNLISVLHDALRARLHVWGVIFRLHAFSVRREGPMWDVNRSARSDLEPVRPLDRSHVTLCRTVTPSAKCLDHEVWLGERWERLQRHGLSRTLQKVAEMQIEFWSILV